MMPSSGFIRRFLPAFLLFAFVGAVSAQSTFPVPAPSDAREGLYAFTNAVIYTDYKTRIEGATLLIRKGKVEACGLNVAVPKDAVAVDCSGKTIYPAFIDIYAAGYGLAAAPQPTPSVGPTPGPNAIRLSQPRTGAYAWNDALRTDFDAVDAYVYDSKSAEEWRKLGFGALLSFRADGISRGTGALLAPTDTREHENILRGKTAHFLSFRKGSSATSFPTSLMGCIALLRQTYLDAQWYKTEGYKEEKNLSLDAWNNLQTLPQIFEASDKLDVLRIARLGQEFNMKYIVKSAGDDYQRLDEIKATGQPMIVGLNFPEAYDVRDPFDAENIALRDLRHWELAPSNPGRIEAAGIPFALTAGDLKDKSKFWEQLRKAIENGLTEAGALKALTYQPAQFINAYDVVGSLEPGKTANFIVCTGNVFKAESKIYQSWVKGRPLVIKDPADVLPVDFPGEYRLTLGADKTYPLFFKGKAEAPDAYLLMGADTTKRTKITLAFENGLLSLSFAADSSSKTTIRLTGALAGGNLAGQGKDAEGNWIAWQATKVKSIEDGPVKPSSAKTQQTGDLTYPFTTFGWKERPKAETFIVRNATVWTNEKDGILQNTDVLVSAGKIQKIGTKLPKTEGVLEIDGSGKFLTSGIIDEHSHIAAARSINESGQESSAEVRIGDVLDSEDIDIYRQLAGGVTSSHILHGSANPIGGQTQLIKLRWGFAPEELKFQNWPGFIKFALGENVKQSNGGDGRRYPQTRMGVEQTYVDYFTRAQDYKRLKASGKPYRRDLELDALAEILDGKRFVTCHSYVQSEITMMIRVAERFGFRLNTFTHILEGYKVADKMAKHGAGGSTFSDWWAYKYEVSEAIPSNAKIMTDQGVTVAINSDDEEMARRLNQEAAKSVGYAHMSEADAWKMVTLNPAKLLHVDDRVGSIKTGKDADLVLWSDNPLSVYARAEKTWVDGIKFYDGEEDAQRRIWVKQERNRLIQKMLNAKKGDGPGGMPTPGKKKYHCDSAEDEG